MITFENLLTAYKCCRLGKVPSNAQTSFELRLGENLLKLEREIRTQTYKPSPYRSFVVLRPKPREIFAANFRDRVVHHLLVSRLEPQWEPRFFHGSFACRKGRGTHGALNYFTALYNRISQGGNRAVWVLQLDIASFFVSIKRPILKRLLLEGLNKSSYDELARLISATLDHDPRSDVTLGSSRMRRNLIPYEKSFFSRAPEEGLPIGNLTSQFGANVYLNSLDHFISRKLRPLGYLRYMDDLTLMDTDRAKLEAMIAPVQEWLKKNRQQELNPSKTILTDINRAPIELLGYRISAPNKELIFELPSSKQWKFLAMLRSYEVNGLDTPEFAHHLSLHENDDQIKKIMGSANSRLGLMRYGKTYQFRKHALTRFKDEINLQRRFLGQKGLIIKKNFTAIKAPKSALKRY
jgi:RNA-directed DNA polymerase